MQIKQVSVEAVNEVVDLFNQYRMFYHQDSDLPGAKSYLEERINNNESIIFLAYEEVNRTVQPLGFTQLYPSFSSVSMKSIWILNDLFVAEKARRRGVAQALLARARQLAEESGAKGLILETDSDNYNAQSLYEKNGYKKDSTIHYHLNL